MSEPLARFDLSTCCFICCWFAVVSWTGVSGISFIWCWQLEVGDVSKSAWDFRAGHRWAALHYVGHSILVSEVEPRSLSFGLELEQCHLSAMSLLTAKQSPQVRSWRARIQFSLQISVPPQNNLLSWQGGPHGRFWGPIYCQVILAPPLPLFSGKHHLLPLESKQSLRNYNHPASYRGSGSDLYLFRVSDHHQTPVIKLRSMQLTGYINLQMFLRQT